MSYIDVVKEVISNVEKVLSLGESLAILLLKYDGETIEDYNKVLAVLHEMGSCSYSTNSKKIGHDLKN